MPWEHVPALVSALQSSPAIFLFDVRVGAPVTDDEIALVHGRLGYTLDPRFLEYFRRHNGLRLRWFERLDDAAVDSPEMKFFESAGQGLRCGSINVPALGSLFPEVMDYRFNRSDSFTPGQHRIPILGGWCADTLRDRLRPLDDYLQRSDDSSFYNVGLVADARYPDPVCILTSDYAAALSDHAPLRARAYLDLVVATCGLTSARLDVMKTGGAPADRPLVERIHPPTPEPTEFLQFLLDRVPLERSREIARACERMSG